MVRLPNEDKKNQAPQAKEQDVQTQGQEQPKVYIVPKAVTIEEMFNIINDKMDIILQQLLAKEKK